MNCVLCSIPFVDYQMNMFLTVKCTHASLIINVIKQSKLIDVPQEFDLVTTAFYPCYNIQRFNIKLFYKKWGTLGCAIL